MRMIPVILKNQNLDKKGTFPDLKYQIRIAVCILLRKNQNISLFRCAADIDLFCTNLEGLLH